MDLNRRRTLPAPDGEMAGMESALRVAAGVRGGRSESRRVGERTFTGRLPQTARLRGQQNRSLGHI